MRLGRFFGVPQNDGRVGLWRCYRRPPPAILTFRCEHADDSRPALPTPRRIMKIGNKTTMRFAPYAAALVFFVPGGHAAAEQSSDQNVRTASFTRSASSNTTHQVTFSRQPAKVGDEVEQNIGLDLQLTLSMRQGNVVTGKSKTSVHTDVRRSVTTTEADNGLMTAVKVHYTTATKQSSVPEANDSSPKPADVPQPVQGKTYICRRNSGAKGELAITDTAGNRPPSEEYEIVSQQMQMVGRHNPLAQFLAGRTITIGEKVALPNDVASQIFNMGDKFGKVSRFTITLQKMELAGGVRCAVFLASVEAISNNSTQMRLDVEGPLVVEVATCRAQKLSLTGPIAMSESRGTFSTAYQVIGTGRLQMSIASAYRDAKKQ